mgnify:CR=1 FL=1
MKEALISNTEEIYKDDGTPLGWRVAQVNPQGDTFPVADTMFWVECADDVVADQFYYDDVTKQINPVPVDTITPMQEQPTTNGTQTL